MAGWTCPDRNDIEWDGRIISKNFKGNGSELTNIPSPSNVPTAIDDGTNITISFNGTALFRIVKATGQMQILGGYDTDITL